MRGGIEKSFTDWHFGLELDSGADLGVLPNSDFSMHDERSKCSKCSRCGSSRTQVIAQSVSPPGAFVRCQDCGHSSLIENGAAPPKPTPNALTQFTPPQPVVDKKRIERLVATVIEAKMLPHHVLSVDKTAAGWLVTLRARVGDSVKFEIRAESMSAMRTAIERALAPA